MTAAPDQREFWLPPPLTAHEHASALGRLGGQARARNERERVNRKAAQIRDELGMAPTSALGVGR